MFSFRQQVFVIYANIIRQNKALPLRCFHSYFIVLPLLFLYCLEEPQIVVTLDNRKTALYSGVDSVFFGKVGYFMWIYSFNKCL